MWNDNEKVKNKMSDEKMFKLKIYQVSKKKEFNYLVYFLFLAIKLKTQNIINNITGNKTLAICIIFLFSLTDTLSKSLNFNSLERRFNQPSSSVK